MTNDRFEVEQRINKIHIKNEPQVKKLQQEVYDIVIKKSITREHIKLRMFMQ